jgi:hypothetical protein
MHFSVSPLEKLDAQILLASGSNVPETGTRSIKVGGIPRPIAALALAENDIHPEAERELLRSGGCSLHLAIDCANLPSGSKFNQGSIL